MNDIGEYIAETAMQEQPMEVNTVWNMLNEIENENLYFLHLYSGGMDLKQSTALFSQSSLLLRQARLCSMAFA